MLLTKVRIYLYSALVSHCFQFGCWWITIFFAAVIELVLTRFLGVIKLVLMPMTFSIPDWLAHDISCMSFSKSKNAGAKSHSRSWSPLYEGWWPLLFFFSLESMICVCPWKICWRIYWFKNHIILQEYLEEVIGTSTRRQMLYQVRSYEPLKNSEGSGTL